ncbi:hypothetical protein [Streptomyces sp. NPDC058382]|uniref:hypothetical protein n=1 Tax=unclassified Streptomyces TaxID=2593676 RepID=UPI00362596AF
MTTIEDIVTARPFPAPGPAEVDPLTEVDALQEAQLLDCRVCALTSTAALLFELRTSLQFDQGNAALLVVRGLRSFDWNAPEAPGPLSALTVVSSVPHRSGDSLAVRLGLFPEGRLDVAGRAAEFYVLDVAGIGDVPPDYVETDLRSVRAALPSWSSVSSVLQATAKD